MKSRFAILTAAVALASALQPTQAQNLTKLAIGYPPALDFLPAIVAKERGCLAKAGYDAQLTVVPIATNIPPALLSGSLQIGMSTPTILLPAVENGLDVAAIAGMSWMAKGNEGVSIVARPDLKVDAASKLEGMKIGVPGLMSVADLVFRKWLTTSGVPANKVVYVEVALLRMAEMLKSKTLDGVVTVEPVMSGLVAQGLGRRAEVEYYSSVADGAMITFWAATGAWARKNPEAIRAFRACLNESATWIKTNREEASEMGKKYLNVSSSFTPNWKVEIVPDDFSFFVDVSREFGLIRSNVDTQKLVFLPD